MRLHSLILPAVLLSCTQESQVKKELFGEIEVVEIDVASRIASRIKEVKVKEGQTVKAGDVLIEFEDDIMAAKRTRAQASIKAAESKLKITNDAVRPEEKRQAKAALAVSQKQLKLAKVTLQRMKKLFKEGAIAQQTLDEVQFKFEAAAEKVEADKAQYRLALTGARSEQKDAAQAMLDQAKTALEEIDAYEADLHLKAPIDGEVLKIISREGELVPTGYPVATLVKTNEPWGTFFVKEDKLSEIKLKQKVKVYLPATKTSFNATISYISAAGRFATYVTTQDKSAVDMKTFEVRALIDKDQLQKFQVRPGQTAILKLGKE